MKKFICTVCGYVHEGDTPPEVCPICKAPASKFEEMAGELKWADEHRIGICEGIDPEIIEGLRANLWVNVQKLECKLLCLGKLTVKDIPR